RARRAGTRGWGRGAGRHARNAALLAARRFAGRPGAARRHRARAREAGDLSRPAPRLLRRVPLRVELLRLGDQVLVPGPPVELGARLLARDLLIEGKRIGERAHLRAGLLDGLHGDL